MFKIDFKGEADQPLTRFEGLPNEDNTREGAIIFSKAELRRQMYQRIALGNALAEAEETAHGEWRGR